eukprot:CAMPEP_0174259450 /NCGR_PEP_ID=MMETSP0439-20130205/8271_1 /TAXON_ID=0 /ORGANISM="Stereomyxa ramosa, Strain Chinc5" /LENGTH=540 /DNA_ID=CAMNT_0015343339 /DNA_START=1049 /DNA_END=2668 /DNA_ORIENTATION=-
MACIDYRGFRLTAMAVLPVSDDTIVYGSNNSGEVVHQSDETIKQVMEENIAKKLNLKPHIAGCKRNTAKLMSFPVDIEVHRVDTPCGPEYYILDFARIFPCEPPRNKEEVEGIWYRLLRRELVQRCSKPLSPDSFTAFQKHDPHMKQNNRDLTSLASILFNQIIPAFVEHLESPKGLDEKDIQSLFQALDLGNKGYVSINDTYLIPPHHLDFFKSFPHHFIDYPAVLNWGLGFFTVNDEVHYEQFKEALEALWNWGYYISLYLLTKRFVTWDLKHDRLIEEARHPSTISLKQELHSWGINMRYLGLVYIKLTRAEWKERVLGEMVVRVAVGSCNVLLRNAMENIRLPTEEPYIKVMIDYLNLVFGNSQRSKDYWNNELKASILKTFFYVLPEDNEHVIHFHLLNLKQNVDLQFCLRSFLQAMGVILTCQDSTKDLVVKQPFSEEDITGVQAMEKPISVVLFATAVTKYQNFIHFRKTKHKLLKELIEMWPTIHHSYTSSSLGTFVFFKSLVYSFKNDLLTALASRISSIPDPTFSTLRNW